MCAPLADQGDRNGDGAGTEGTRCRGDLEGTSLRTHTHTHTQTRHWGHEDISGLEGMPLKTLEHGCLDLLSVNE